MTYQQCDKLSLVCASGTATGVVALLVSLLTAGALALHLTYGGSAAAASWSLAGLRLSGRQHTAAQQQQRRQAALSCGDSGNLTQLLCDPASAHYAADGSSRGNGAGGRPRGIATGLPASWAAGHIAHDFRHWRHTGIRKKALDKLASDVDVHKVGIPNHRLHEADCSRDISDPARRVSVLSLDAQPLDLRRLRWQLKWLMWSNLR